MSQMESRRADPKYPREALAVVRETEGVRAAAAEGESSPSPSPAVWQWEVIVRFDYRWWIFGGLGEGTGGFG